LSPPGEEKRHTQESGLGKEWVGENRGERGSRCPGNPCYAGCSRALTWISLKPI
jgi:hypothetical protein